ncbi:unnamed protein product [Penicillium nalgiovense]|nr:unnamed protein product [Penicillium nalgiovense]
MNSDPRLSKMQSTERLPSYEETTKASKALVTKFITQVENAQYCNSLLLVLLSDNGLGIGDKCKAVEDAHRIPAIERGRDAESVEDTLRLRGIYKLAQSVCYYFHIRHTSLDRNWCKALIETDIEIRWTVQRMIWVYQRERVMGSRTFDQNLKSLKRKYWRAHRKLWIEEDSIGSKSAARGFAFQRQKIDWYHSSELHEDCARGGGCCGWRCRCCAIPRTTDGLRTEGMRNRGHCTSACSCCLDAHGLDGNDIRVETTDLQGLRFDTSNTERLPDHHTLRLLKGYIFST